MKKGLEINVPISWILCCFLNFLIAAIMGLFLRFCYIFPVDINYIFLLHAHSHVAMLGWVYMIIYVLIIQFFIPKDKRKKIIYKQLFWCTEIIVIGMMISFPLEGYGVFSILFSTSHILLSYVFSWLVLRDSVSDKVYNKQLLATAILLMIFSTFGVWCLGTSLGTFGKQSAFYQIAIQFFLHFQFNGWFLIAVLALFLKQFEHEIDIYHFNFFWVLMIISTLLTLAFPINWYVDCKMLKWINVFGVLMQVIAFFYFYKMLKNQIITFKESLNTTSRMVYGLAISSLFFKIGLQVLVLLRDLSETSHQIRNFVIGFIHLTSLGIITGFLLGILIQNKMLSEQSYLLRLGMKFFIFGYAATEVLLFVQGLFFYFEIGKISGYYESIFVASLLIVSGLVLVILSILNKKQGSIN